MEQFIIDITKFVTIAAVSFSLFITIRPIDFTFWKKIFLGFGFVVAISAVLYAVDYNLMEPYKTLIVIAVSTLLLKTITKERFETALPSFIISYAASYVLRGLSIFLSVFISYPLGISEDNLLLLNSVACIICIGIVIMLSKIKIDLKFLLKKGVGGIFIFISGMVFLMYSFVREYGEDFSLHLRALTIIGFVLLCYGAYSWWSREETIARNEDKYEVIENRHQAIIDEKERDYKLLKETHDLLALKDHKDNKTLDTLQESIVKVIMRTHQTDIIKEATTILKEIDRLKDRFDGIKTKKLYKGVKLPQTDLLIVDTKFEMMFSEARTKDIDFTLEIHGDFNEDDIEKIVTQLDLANIIGDFAKNAFIAIRHLNTNDTYRKVNFVLKNDNGILELSAEDSGIPFEIETLIALGIEPVTTHADDGGSGRGYETIFEMMDEYKASLTITEYEQTSNTYTKQIALCFDGKEIYTIKSPRADKLKRQNTGNRDINILSENIHVGV